LLRLQNILVLRDLGLSLKRIREVIDEQVDPIVAIEGQLDAVEQQKQRLIKIQNALENTKLRLLEGEQIMLSESFDGFENDPYAQEAEQRWPDDYAKSQERVSKLTSGQQEAVMEEHGEIARGLASLLKSEVAADSPEVQELIDRHYKWVCNFWTPDSSAYQALGQMYVDDPRFTATYDAFAVGLAVFIRDAIRIYSSSNLG
jgi:DNA-binding transcriptional MerR regulator